MYDDKKRVKIRRAVVRPIDFFVPVEASNIHGITHDIACTEGEPLESVLAELMSDVTSSHELVAHNMAFDRDVIRAELARSKVPLAERRIFRDIPKACTMLTLAEKGRKWPRLAEAYLTHCGKVLQGAHQATHDTEACAELYFKLKDDNRDIVYV